MLMHHQPIYSPSDYAADHTRPARRDHAARPGRAGPGPGPPAPVGEADRRRDHAARGEGARHRGHGARHRGDGRVRSMTDSSTGEPRSARANRRRGDHPPRGVARRGSGRGAARRRKRAVGVWCQPERHRRQLAGAEGPDQVRRQPQRRIHGRWRAGQHRRALRDLGPGHRAAQSALRAASGPRRRLQPEDAARGVDDARRQDPGHVDRAAASGGHVPQRPAGDGRRRDLLAETDHQPEDPGNGSRIDRLHRLEADQEARPEDRESRAPIPERGLPRRRRPVLQRHRSRSATTPRTRSGPGRSSTRASLPASRACSSATPTIGTVRRTSTR